MADDSDSYAQGCLSSNHEFPFTTVAMFCNRINSHNESFPCVFTFRNLAVLITCMQDQHDEV